MTAPKTPAVTVIHLVAGGHQIVLLNDPDSAAIMNTVMVGANLDTTTATLTPTQWAKARAHLNDDVTIVNLTGNPDLNPAEESHP